MQTGDVGEFVSVAEVAAAAAAEEAKYSRASHLFVLKGIGHLAGHFISIIAGGVNNSAVRA